MIILHKVGWILESVEWPRRLKTSFLILASVTMALEQCLGGTGNLVSAVCNGRSLGWLPFSWNGRCIGHRRSYIKINKISDFLNNFYIMTSHPGVLMYREFTQDTTCEWIFLREEAMPILLHPRSATVIPQRDCWREARGPQGCGQWQRTRLLGQTVCAHFKSLPISCGNRGSLFTPLSLSFLI